jgi:hypothetical protein
MRSASVKPNREPWLPMLFDVSMEALIALALFMALVLASALQGLAASGHFPRADQPASGVAPLILFGTIALVALSLAAGSMAALRLLPWYAAVISGGLSVLVAPPVLQAFPDRFVDGRGSLLAFAAAGAVFALSLVCLLARADY